jgi:hypothetical protein
MASFLAVALMYAGAGQVAAPDAAVVATLQRFADVKPGAEALRFYSLDWVCSLGEAKQRAAAEKRPILVVLNTNITAHCNLYSGHT